MPQAIHISPIDNVVVALHPIAKGTLVEVDGLSVTALEDIPQGHKMAVKPIKNGENVIKYGFPIGHATADAAVVDFDRDSGFEVVFVNKPASQQGYFMRGSHGVLSLYLLVEIDLLVDLVADDGFIIAESGDIAADMHG